MAFSDNIWWTKKARIEAEKRLLMYSFQSQVLLLWYSFSGVAASIYHLKKQIGKLATGVYIISVMRKSKIFSTLKVTIP